MRSRPLRVTKAWGGLDEEFRASLCAKKITWEPNAQVNMSGVLYELGLKKTIWDMAVNKLGLVL